METGLVKPTQLLCRPYQAGILDEGEAAETNWTTIPQAKEPSPADSHDRQCQSSSILIPSHSGGLRPQQVVVTPILLS